MGLQENEWAILGDHSAR